MSLDIDRIKALMARAIHKNTPVEEARSSALIAIKQIAKYKLEIIDPKVNPTINVESSYDDDMHSAKPSNPHNTADWVEVKNFNIKMAKSAGVCVSCNKEFFKSEVIAFVFNGGTTHYKCRHYWTTHQS